MRKIIGLWVLGGLILTGCDDQIEIQYQPFKSKPVIYCVIDPTDTLHIIRIERVFSGIQPPAVTSRNPDSLYFSEPKVTVSLFYANGNGGATFEPECVEVNNKQPGYFSSPRQYLYQFKKRLQPFSTMSLKVEIPGLPLVEASTRIIREPVIWSPNPSQQFIYMVPDSPLRIQWSGGSWNELDFRFEIKEEYPDSITTQTIQFQKVNNGQINGQYYEIRIPYDLVVQAIDKNLKVDRSVKKRYFGPVYFTISTGLKDYADYMEFYGGINDFNENPFSNIENALGLLTTRSSIKKGPYLFDQPSRFYFAKDPVLQKLNFIEY
ncbi:MAG: hypothetical protein WC699_07560 [Bacteroidales bacterium]|jgi:hypothetical protein